MVQKEERSRFLPSRRIHKLTSNYKLITATFTHGKDAYIKLTDLQGNTFTTSSGIFDPKTLAKTSPTLVTVLLIDLTGKDYSKQDLLTRFHISPRQYKRGRKALEALR
ncbi:hypothetical protein ACFL2G_02970 [Candidatus Omnitrophota bacterium]